MPASIIQPDEDLDQPRKFMLFGLEIFHQLQCPNLLGKRIYGVNILDITGEHSLEIQIKSLLGLSPPRFSRVMVI
ncbi:hypothetical protein CLCR_09302 [Cladophialophora carrionii]|uniref:Uncharacterized protein n=1 Tax=Cladophialophora carrionii TaxID=86049 RepID=A0A1C1CRQ2_9EURO|nr:hypothetical protein CLCR_09302 [Cladophialophora carrionii]